MCIFKIDDNVKLKTGETGSIIGYFSGDFTIILLSEPDSKGQKGRVVHATDLEKINNN
jgi:hypothetical protein